MAKLFTDRYLRYSGRKPLGAYQREVLVPMNAWRVLVPERSSEALNIFEEAIIGLVASRCSDIRKIAGLLCLAEALVEYIVQQMKMNGWLTERMGVTPKGKRILEKQVQLRTRLTTGYVFQDMFTGELMPRFVHDLKYIEATEYQHGKPCFKLDIAKEKSYTPTIVRLPKSEQLLQPPSPFQVVDAIRDHNVAIYNSKLQSDEFLDLERIQHDSIELVDSSPVRVYLWCWLYRQDKAGRHWFVTDPIGISPASEWLRNRLNRQLEQQPELAGTLNQMFGIERSEKIDWQARDEEIDESSRLELLSDYPNIKNVPLAEKYLLAVIRRTKHMESREKVYREDIDSLIGEAQKLAEALFQWMLKKWPASSLERIPDQVPRWQRPKFYQALGLDILDSEIIRVLANQELYVIKKALGSGQSSLKALMAASALTTCEHIDSHPLKSLSSDQLQYAKLIELAELRNPASHANARKFNKDEALNAGEIAKNLTKVLTGWM